MTEQVRRFRPVGYSHSMREDVAGDYVEFMEFDSMRCEARGQIERLDLLNNRLKEELLQARKELTALSQAEQPK